MGIPLLGAYHYLGCSFRCCCQFDRWFGLFPVPSCLPSPTARAASAHAARACAILRRCCCCCRAWQSRCRGAVVWRPLCWLRHPVWERHAPGTEVIQGHCSCWTEGPVSARGGRSVQQVWCCARCCHRRHHHGCRPREHAAAAAALVHATAGAACWLQRLPRSVRPKTSASASAESKCGVHVRGLSVESKDHGVCVECMLF